MIIIKKGVILMGLDNGIILISKNKIEEEKLPFFMKGTVSSYDNNTNKEYRVTIAYYRKCYDLRNKIMKACNCPDNDEIELSRNSLIYIRGILIDYLIDYKSWDKENSIWDFEEMIEHLTYDILRLSWAIDYISNNSFSYCYFYDSY